MLRDVVRLHNRTVNVLKWSSSAKESSRKGFQSFNSYAQVPKSVLDAILKIVFKNGYQTALKHCQGNT